MGPCYQQAKGTNYKLIHHWRMKNFKKLEGMVEIGGKYYTIEGY